MSRGVNNSGASSSGQPCRDDVKTCHNCGSPNQLQYNCHKPRTGQYQYRGAFGGHSGQGDRGDVRVNNAMASTSMSQQMLVDQIKQLSATRASMQAGSLYPMSAHACGMYLKLHAVILDSGSSKHMSPNRDMLTDYKQLAVSGVVKFGGGTFAKSVGIGTLSIV